MPFLTDSGSGIAVPIAGAGGLGHQFEAAPDGNTYFTVLGPSINLVRSLRNLIEAQRIYATMPRGQGRDQAAAIGVIIRELELAVHRSGVATAQFAQDRARTILERRIIRPQTPKPDHLRDAIVARAIAFRGQPGSWGAVGIGDITLLDAFPYWKAQEFGSTHLVGAKIRGFFFEPGGPTAPGGAPNRSQAIFRPGKGPTMHIQNPIVGKRFLTEASFDALEFRFRIWRGVEKAAVAQTRSVRVATAGDLAGARYSRTVGGFANIARFRPGSLPIRRL